MLSEAPDNFERCHERNGELADARTNPFIDPVGFVGRAEVMYQKLLDNQKCGGAGQGHMTLPAGTRPPGGGHSVSCRMQSHSHAARAPGSFAMVPAVIGRDYVLL